MPRQETLLRLHKTLLARSAELRRNLGGELASLREFRVADSTGDSAEAAFETSSDEMSSQLAELEARELCQIERALARLKQGTYGMCEGGGENCQKRIRAARLNALPYTTLCINCEREMEKHPDWQTARGEGNWEQVFNSEASMREQRIDLSELQTSMCRDR